MSETKFLKKLNIEVEGVPQITYLYYNPNGTVDVYQFPGNNITRERKKNPGVDGTLIYSNSDEVVMTGSVDLGNGRTYFWQTDDIESAIKDDTDILNKIKNQQGALPNFLTNRDIAIANDPISKRLREKFLTTEKDTYFGDLGSGNSAQYPIDALYGKRYPDSQDHLVISQYRYKAPRADAIFGENASPSSILMNGITRGSPLDEFLGLVRLPMPNAIQDSNNVAWGEDSVNALEAAALAASDPSGGDALAGITGGVIGAFSDGITEGAKNAIAANVGRQMIDGIKIENTILQPEIQSRILATLGIETSAEAILARKEGVVPNSNLELLFSGPTLRQFSFVYKMSPRSSREATIVNRILRFFKQGMAARKQNSKGGGGTAGGASYFLGTPNVFRLQYRTTEDEAIKGLNRIKTCALTGTSVNYTPEGAFASYDGGQPVSVLLTLAFQELEPIYDSDYKFEGGDGERSDRDDTSEGYRWKIRPEEVGY